MKSLRCPIAQAFDEPLVVVGLDEGSHSLAEIVRILEQPDQRYCSVTVRMKRLATPLLWGSPAKAASSSMLSQLRGPWKWWAGTGCPGRGGAWAIHLDGNYLTM